MSAQHEKWLARAGDDLGFAELGLKNEYYSQVCFLSHQCIEKCLKGAIVREGRVYERTHSLIKLINGLPWFERRAEHLLDDISIIDKFYIPTRYPDGVPGGLPDGLPGPEHANMAFRTAKAVFEMTCKELRSASA
jgi:HEPN domain-containing protein